MKKGFKILAWLIGALVSLLIVFMVITKISINRTIDYAFESVDQMLGIERDHYRILRRDSKLFVLQDPVAIQKIRLKSKGKEILDRYISSYQDSVESLGGYPPEIIDMYKPSIDYEYCHIQNNIPERTLKIYHEILDDTPESFVKMQTSQVGKYFEQYCWLGGDYWRIIVDTEKGIIYRKYGSI